MIAAGSIGMVKRGEPEKKAMWTAVKATSGAATIQISIWRRPIQRSASARISSGNQPDVEPIRNHGRPKASIRRTSGLRR